MSRNVLTWHNVSAPREGASSSINATALAGDAINKALSGLSASLGGFEKGMQSQAESEAMQVLSQFGTGSEALDAINDGSAFSNVNKRYLTAAAQRGMLDQVNSLNTMEKDRFNIEQYNPAQLALLQAQTEASRASAAATRANIGKTNFAQLLAERSFNQTIEDDALLNDLANAKTSTEQIAILNGGNHSQQTLLRNKGKFDPDVWMRGVGEVTIPTDSGLDMDQSVANDKQAIIDAALRSQESSTKELTEARTQLQKNWENIPPSVQQQYFTGQTEPNPMGVASGIIGEVLNQQGNGIDASNIDPLMEIQKREESGLGNAYTSGAMMLGMGYDPSGTIYTGEPEQVENFIRQQQAVSKAKNANNVALDIVNQISDTNPEKDSNLNKLLGSANPELFEGEKFGSTVSTVLQDSENLLATAQNTVASNDDYMAKENAIFKSTQTAAELLTENALVKDMKPKDVIKLTERLNQISQVNNLPPELVLRQAMQNYGSLQSFVDANSSSSEYKKVSADAKKASDPGTRQAVVQRFNTQKNITANIAETQNELKNLYQAYEILTVNPNLRARVPESEIKLFQKKAYELTKKLTKYRDQLKEIGDVSSNK